MNEIISNYHSHIYLCKHATSTIPDIIERAIKLGYKVIGISDHGPYNEEFIKTHPSRRMSYEEYYNIYLKDLAYYKELYKDKITVLSGLEIEYFDDIKDEVSKFKNNHDYLILGEHVYYSNNDYHKFSDIKFDHNKIQLTKEELLHYFNMIKEGIKSNNFKILAHPDLFMIGYPILDDDVKKETKEIVELCNKYDVYLEFNCNGLRTKKVKNNLPNDYPFDFLYMYPRFDYWEYVIKECNPKHIIISDDNHHTKNLCDSKTKFAYNYFKKNNYPLENIIKL